MTSIASAQAAISALLGMTRAATAAAVDHQLKEKLIDIQAAILEAQQKLGDAQADRLSLLHDVAELRQKMRDLERSRATLDSYELHEIDAGKFLYKAKVKDHAVSHYACPPCHNGDKVSVLQTAKTGTKQVTYICKTCKFTLAVGPSDPLRVSSVSRDSFRDW